MSKIAIISLSGLGNSLLTALALNNSTYSKNESTIYLANNFSKSIFEYYRFNLKFKIYKQGRFRRLFLILKDLISSDYNKIIIEPNTSESIVNVIRLFSFKKVIFIRNSKTNPIEIDYQKLFNFKNNILNSKQFIFNNNDKVMIYPCVESSDKYSKKITEIQLDLIIDYLKKINLRYLIIIPLYEKNQITLNFINKHNSQIKFIDKFSNFKKLIQFFNEYDIYVGGDTFYYHLMTKALMKKSFTFFGSTSYKRFIYKNELTKYFYPDCPNYPTYNKYFFKIKYCNHCEANYCIEKLNVKSLDIELIN